MAPRGGTAKRPMRKLAASPASSPATPLASPLRARAAASRREQFQRRARHRRPMRSIART
eukprot:4493288-Pyramimonas_sp.AAC.1